MKKQSESLKKLTTKTKQAAKKKKPEPLFKSEIHDPAHSPAHRKLNISDNYPEHSGAKVHIQESALNNLANVKRSHSKNRRIITGAAVGKTGRIIIKP